MAMRLAEESRLIDREVLAWVRRRRGQIGADEIREFVTTSTKGFNSSEVNGAIWRLVDQGKLVFTPTRTLVLTTAGAARESKKHDRQKRKASRRTR